jgi:rhodanese-related sulfurtransferase
VYRIAGSEVVEGYRTLRRIAEARIAELERVTNEFFGTLDGVEPIGRDELLSKVRTGDVTVIDVRPIAEYRNGHIEGAISLPLEELARHLEEFPPNRQIVAYCRGPYCVLSLEAVRLLRRQGRKAIRLEDGFPEWLDAGFPVESLV